MPFSSPHYPNLALGLLKPLAERAGATCDVRYFSLDYLEFLGADAYAPLTEPSIYMAQAGEWVFAAAADPRIDPDGLGFLTDVLLRQHPDAYRPALLMALLGHGAAPPPSSSAASMPSIGTATPWSASPRRSSRLWRRWPSRGASGRAIRASRSRWAAPTARTRWGGNCWPNTTASMRSAWARASTPSPRSSAFGQAPRWTASLASPCAGARPRPGRPHGY